MGIYRNYQIADMCYYLEGLKMYTYSLNSLDVISAVLFFTALLIEWTVAWRKSQALYERQDFLASMGVMLLTVVLDG